MIWNSTVFNKHKQMMSAASRYALQKPFFFLVVTDTETPALQFFSQQLYLAGRVARQDTTVGKKKLSRTSASLGILAQGLILLCSTSISFNAFGQLPSCSVVPVAIQLRHSTAQQGLQDLHRKLSTLFTVSQHKYPRCHDQSSTVTLTGQQNISSGLLLLHSLGLQQQNNTNTF